MKVFFTSVSALLGMAVGRASAHEDGLNHLLLEKAMPLEEYESQLIASGGKAFSHKLGLGSDESTRRRKLGNAYYAGDDASNYTGYSAGGDDDYFQIDKAINFNGYALKYATCQKVQRYSVTAVQRGQYSSMVTDDVVILRLCPKRSCNTNSRYGCMSGYGEYAMDVSEYMTIVMKYQANKEETFCSFCNSCAASSSYANYFDDDLYANQTASNAYQSSNSDACYTYSTQCSNVLNSCNNNDDDNSTSVDYDAMQGYFGCQAKDDYYVSPHCDPRTGTIEMGIFYDNHCAQDAGDSVSVSNFLGDDFDTDVFASSQEDVLCLDCSASQYAPFYNSQNLFCNNVYENSGQCDENLAYDLGKVYSDDYYNNNAETQDEHTCSFIESVRYGTYDAYGEIYVSSSQFSNIDGVITGGQKTALLILSTLVATLSVFSCFIHHQMTDLLLKSLRNGLISPQKRYVRRSPSDASSDDGSVGSSTLGSAGSSTLGSTLGSSSYV